MKTTTKSKKSAKELLHDHDMEIAEVLNNISNPTNFTERKPYSVNIEIEGTCPIIFHKWNCEEVENKANAKKGSKEKKTDNVESFIYRDDVGHICLPGEYLRMSMVYASKFKADPRSPRKSAFDLMKASIVPVTDLAKINGGTKNWEFLDKRRVVIQRNAITRMRPAFLKGWNAEIEMAVLMPEYIDIHFFREILDMSGKLIGVGDFRPTFGRFAVTRSQVKKYEL
ncbi:MAG TPA: hypothetical protein VFG46_02240 [Chryseolinea sp.]|nr:hypothetical protein [Chryseolinea sp.]